MSITRKSSLEQLADNLEKLDGTHQVSFAELFPDSFMRAKTKCSSMQEFLDKSGFKIESMDDFAAIPDNEWDEYIRSNTAFADWKSMQTAAMSAWTCRKLGLA